MRSGVFSGLQGSVLDTQVLPLQLYHHVFIELDLHWNQEKKILFQHDFAPVHNLNATAKTFSTKMCYNYIVSCESLRVT